MCSWSFGTIAFMIHGIHIRKLRLFMWIGLLPYLHLELPGGDNCIFTIRKRGGLGQRRQRERERGKRRWLRMIETVFNAGGVFCMAMVGQGGWFYNGWVDKCRGLGSNSSWEGVCHGGEKLCVSWQFPRHPFSRKTSVTVGHPSVSSLTTGWYSTWSCEKHRKHTIKPRSIPHWAETNDLLNQV